MCTCKSSLVMLQGYPLRPQCARHGPGAPPTYGRVEPPSGSTRAQADDPFAQWQLVRCTARRGWRSTTDQGGCARASLARGHPFRVGESDECVQAVSWFLLSRWVRDKQRSGGSLCRASVGRRLNKSSHCFIEGCITCVPPVKETLRDEPLRYSKTRHSKPDTPSPTLRRRQLGSDKLHLLKARGLTRLDRPFLPCELLPPPSGYACVR